MTKVIRTEITFREASFYGKEELDLDEKENDTVYEVRYTVEGTDTLHREDGPAFIGHDLDGTVEREFYYVNGTCHRIDGPACTWYNNNGEVYICRYMLLGKPVKKEDFETPGFIDAFILENS